VDGAAELVNATAIAAAGRAALIRGASGTGKSDLALRCLAHGASPLLPSPARLVSDDWVRIFHAGDALRAEAPEAIRGKLEVRGLGIVAVDYAGAANVALLVEISPPDEIERLPDENARGSLMGVSLPLLRVAAFEASAPIKVLLALAATERPSAG
jgi:serine kinase of HPr protein (carbohydrate metabolism regulator)